MSTSAELHLCYKVGNAPLSLFPYPHFFVQDVFPRDYYQRLQQCLPDPEAMIPIADARPVHRGYKNRFVLEPGGDHLAGLPEEKRNFWQEMQEWLVGGRFGELLFSKFAPFIEERFRGQSAPQFYDESLLVEDVTNYRLDPHTDAKHKVVTLLFYLPKDDSLRHLGTSIYMPKEMGFSCQGGPSHARDRFDLMYTMPFLPNSLFCFLKTYNSFRGVEAVTDQNCRRWLLLYDIYARQDAASEPAARQPAGVQFSI